MADALTKYVSREDLEIHARETWILFGGGRRCLAPEVTEGEIEKMEQPSKSVGDCKEKIIANSV